jgi:Outer membrane protein beta-barrel domain
MKKSICLSALVFAVITVMGQSQFGFFAGPQLSSSKYSINSTKQPNTGKYGFQLGAGWKIPFEERLSFSPAAFYSLKGYKVKFNLPAFPPDTLAVDNNTTIHTFELGFLIQFDMGGKPDHFFLKAGPSLDFQLSGKEKFRRTDNTEVDRKMRFSFGDYGHYGANMLVQLGYETHNGLFLFAQYTHGLASINNADYGPLIRHRVYGISVGKFMGKRRPPSPKNLSPTVLIRD